MANSAHRMKLIHEFYPEKRMNFQVNTSATTKIEVGDLLELSDTDGKVQLFDDDTCAASHRFIGVAASAWDPAQNDKLALTDISVIPAGRFRVELASAAYKFGDPLQYDASANDGALKAGVVSQQLVAWFGEGKSGTITEGEVIMDVFDLEYSTLEVMPTA